MPPHGPCEYCPGGKQHAELQVSLAKLKAAVVQGGSEWLWERRLALPPPGPAPQAGGCGSGGCGGCGSAILQIKK